jgi:Mce-associated membrane protein
VTDKNDDQDTTVKETTAVPVETDVTDTDADAEKTAKHAADESTEKADESTEATDEAGKDTAKEPDDAEPAKATRKINWSRVLAFGILPGLVLLLAMAAGFLKWQDTSARDSDIANGESAAAGSVQAAKDSTIALLSYKPDTVEQQLVGARDLLTGDFRDSYTSLTNDVVIPGAKEKQISAVASVPAAASVSADPNHAVVLVFVNQTVVVGTGAPTDTASSVRVILDKIDDRWLISNFEPV